MTDRQRFLTALAGRQPENYVPVWELEFHLYDAYSPDPLVLGRDFAKLTAAEKDCALHRNAEIMVTIARQLGHAAISAIGGFWEVAPGQDAYLWFPDDYPWKFLPILHQVAGQDIAVVVLTGALIGPPSGDQYEQFCYRIFDDPKSVAHQAEQRLTHALDEIKRARDLGADAACETCDIADNHGVFYNPQQMDRFWYPYLHKFTAAAKDLGMSSILHSDGNLTSILPQLAGSGLNALQAIDPIAGMDIVAVKAQFGRKLCLCGNIDCGLLHFGPPEKIREQTRHVCERIKPGGGFVLGASNAVFREMPKAHYEAMRETWRQYGTY